MEISIKSDMKKLTRHLDRIQKKQVPFALSQALNDTAFDARAAVQGDLPKYLDRPTPFTVRGVRVRKSTKRQLRASVYFAPDQAKYIKYQITGGVRLPNKKAIPVPVGVARNRYGNMPKGKVKQLLQRPDTFIGTIKGVGGIWQRGHYSKAGRFSASNKRRATTVRLLLAFEPKATYRPRLPYGRIVEQEVRAKFTGHFNRRLATALRTAR